MSDYIYGSATSLAKAIRDKHLSAAEVVSAHLKRIEAVNGRLNAVVQLAHERAMAEARDADQALAEGVLKGPLHGVPVTIKDSLDTAGIISTWGTLGRKSFVPDQDATVVARLREAGAIVMGKTNTPELTLGGEMENVIYGATHNPYDLSRSPSGSSGGAAAIVAAGDSPLDLGSDTGGSIREPAHVCGIAGIKPTFGRTPRTGHAVHYGPGIVDGLTQIGPLARYVEDLVLTLPIIAGPDWQDSSVIPMPFGDPAAIRTKDLHVAFYTDGGLHAPTADIIGTVRTTAKSLADLGVEVEEAVPAALLRASDLYRWLTFGDGGNWIRRRLQEAGTSEPGPHLERMLQEAESAELPDLPTILHELQHYRQEMLRFIECYDAILCPVDAYAAVPHGGSDDPDKHDVWGHMYAYNLTGWPAVVVRAGATAENLPIGVQIVGRPWREDVVFAIGQAIEKSLGGYQPPSL